MTAKQYIYKARRTYNQWVNDQTLEDYALRFTAKASRRWSLARVANTALGAISFLALEAIGAAITLNYGFHNALTAVALVGTIIFCAGLPICYYAAKYGVDIDLLTRGAGFGYIGSTATSLIYASFTFIFFALEAAIMARALELTLNIPLALGYILSSIIVIPLVFYGVTFISRFQLWTQPIWIVLQLIPFYFVLKDDTPFISEWISYSGSHERNDFSNLLNIGACASILFALVAQIGEQVDFLRFLPPKDKSNSLRWWAALVLAGPGWIFIGCIKILIGSFLGVVALNYVGSTEEAIDPTSMYTIAFGFVTDNQNLALAIAGFFVVLSQLKINVTNAYAGSIAWSNFFSRLTHNHPGRVVWLIFNVVIALLLMELGIYHAFESTLSVYAIIAVSWVGALVSDLIINKPLGLSPRHIEFRRAYLYDINPVGIGSTLIASIIGIAAYLNIFGSVGHALSHFIALLCAFCLVPFIAWLTKSKFYIARPPNVFTDKNTHIECSICQNNYETEDMAHCPAYESFICSLCCSLDARCKDLCKSSLGIKEKLTSFTQQWFPKKLRHYIDPRLIQFIFLLALVAGVTGVLLILVYTNSETSNLQTNLLLASSLWKVFFILLIVAGVICWLFVLAHQSQAIAQEESRAQTKRLIQEIEAHEKTDRQLQNAKEQAEAANNAKSRYLTGINHELRTPLNTILGYAQLMTMDAHLSIELQTKVSVIKRSGEHLADLIEGLLDISQIEAGRLDIQRNPIQFMELLNQLEQMFRLQAQTKGLAFTYDTLSHLPKTVIGDEKRVRQILINILSNAIKFTEKGKVKLTVRYRNQVAEFKIYDTGVGISDDDIERIFKPFERIRKPGHPAPPGTGLGLTITRLLTDIMGGDISIAQNASGGSIFTVSLMLSNLPISASKTVKPKTVNGFKGKAKSIMVIDDDATHRGLISDLLNPLGFNVIEAHDADSCLMMIQDFHPDLFFIDRKMPGADGLQLAKQLRQKKFPVPIIIISANTNKDTWVEDDNRIDTPLEFHDDYLIKPIKLDQLLGIISKHLHLTWNYLEEKTNGNKSISSSSVLGNGDVSSATTYIPEKIQSKLLAAAKIGNLSELKQCIAELESIESINSNFVKLLSNYIDQIRFDEVIRCVKGKVNERSIEQ